MSSGYEANRVHDAWYTPDLMVALLTIPGGDNFETMPSIARFSLSTGLHFALLIELAVL